MASRLRLAGGIPEQRVRQIWDAFDSRQFKTAYKLAVGLLAKYPNSPYALYQHKVGEKEWIARKHIETESLIPRLLYLSIQSFSSSLKEKFETNGSVSDTTVIVEMKCLLERYARNIGLPFDDAIDVILAIAKGQKSFKLDKLRHFCQCMEFVLPSPWACQ
ncbi:N-terminal acetyltransferase B complex auxiliary subunit NAA25-like [Phoenix dactylifera]|uniref:N-terminal acetyltransferase B complex auxiliary subunit NAA25-like n=1 Tax=Phoenix dactylifera TaxID=42345 RepID=A0A8B7CQF6_PHODC|nr:N-terminal acetyltransferase B complex auxiliary subunit NAA25-like [Phoenix dactylifera]